MKNPRKRFPHGRVALITGASSGIGAETARLFANAGYTVYAASRRGTLPEGFPDAAALAIHPLVMDIASEESVQAGAARIAAEQGGVDVLVHAAGNGLSGPIECCTAADAAAQMDINYFGALRLINAVLPGMRSRGRGLLLLVGSVGGEFSIPYQTLYSASKAALAMLADGLRLELRPFGVHAALVAPGDVRTGFTAARRDVPGGCPEAYAPYMRRAVSQMEKDEQNGMPPEAVAAAILRMAKRPYPPPRRVAGGMYALFVFLKRLLPARLVERLLYIMYLK